MTCKTGLTVDQRNALIDDYLSGMYTKLELCERGQITRPTLDKWLDRFDRGGRDALIDQSRRPLSCPHRTDAELEQLIIAVRQKHPHWGAKKILHYLALKDRTRQLPAVSTANDILDRSGLLQKRSRRRSVPLAERGRAREVTAANQVRAIDFKGQFRLGNGQYCYALTVTDEYARYLLVCEALSSPRLDGVRAKLERSFIEHGLPERIRSDNGRPFAGTGLSSLSRLNVWFTKLGIVHDLSRPGCPQDNGRHERMHRTMGQETTRPPGFDHKQQQTRFDGFRTEFNDERPHQALDGKTPSMLWEPSPRQMPTVLPAPEYAGHLEVRSVGPSGNIKFKGVAIFLSDALVGEHVGLEEVDDGIWSVWFYQRLLARLNERTGELR